MLLFWPCGRSAACPRWLSRAWDSLCQHALPRAPHLNLYCSAAGLDARAAAIVMRTVRNIVNTGRTIVCTIHQPSIDIFEVKPLSGNLLCTVPPWLFHARVCLALT